MTMKSRWIQRLVPLVRIWEMIRRMLTEPSSMKDMIPRTNQEVSCPPLLFCLNYALGILHIFKCEMGGSLCV